MLTFAKRAPGLYVAAGAFHAYAVVRWRHGWRLQIHRGQNVIAPSWRHRRKGRALATARAFESLGENFDPAAYGHRSRTIVAMEAAYSGTSTAEPS